MSDALLRLDDLVVTGPRGRLLGPLDLDLRAGECLGLVGESGSGKSLATLALLGLLPPELAARGALRVDGATVALGSPAHAALRGRTLGWVPQDPLASLHPMRTVGAQLRETLVRIGGAARAAARAEAADLLARVRLPAPDALLARFPHQLSGGQRQRVLIALALAARPRVLIADEPTSALDPSLAREVLDLLDALRRELGLALLLIGHDLPQVRRVAQRVAVLRRGEVVERGATAAVLEAPAHAYTRELLAAAALPTAVATTPGPRLLEAEALRVRYPRAAADAVDGVDLVLHRGECLALLGESGSGKSTLGRALLRLARSHGRILLDGQPIEALDARRLRPLRRRIGIVFQDPYASLDPRQRIAEIVAEPLRVHGVGDAAARRARAAELLRAVGLDADALPRYPHQFSGGQRQRIAIARALATDPDLLVCDEAVSALDAHHRAGILRLLGDLRTGRGLALLFITHDVDAARALADRIAVMHAGRIVETGPAATLLAAPAHPATRGIVAVAGG
ncbi:nickel ABC transporter ATP-binding protein NikE [Coralloluteibacterium thermophilus]|uniref:Nickel ABC transporter ATP-binding protein NikE n=1 Tax=Coralloluteibacterium thermophilum TaxID=2707049 RepID=A0ABV9NK40_9GAMM